MPETSAMRRPGRRPPPRGSTRRDNAAKADDNLTKEDHHRAHETTIQKGLGTFMEVGNALKWIRDNGTYQTVDDFDTFEAYVKAKWDMARRTAYQQIDAAVTVGNVRNCAQTEPTNEYQVRPLVCLEPEQQRDAWRRAVEKAEGERPTGRLVQQAVKELKRESEAAAEDKEPDPEAEVQARVEKLEAAAAMVQKQSKKMSKTISEIEEVLQDDNHLSGEGPQLLRKELENLHDHVGALLKRLDEVEEKAKAPNEEKVDEVDMEGPEHESENHEGEQENLEGRDEVDKLTEAEEVDAEYEMVEAEYAMEEEVEDRDHEDMVEDKEMAVEGEDEE